MTAAQEDRPAGSTLARSQPSRLTALRGASMGASVMLIAQYVLGIWVNLYVSVPAADNGTGFAAAIGRALANGPATLAAHAALGLLLVVTGISALVRAILARHRAVIVTSAIGLVAIIGAGSGGAAFVGNGQDGASFAMAWLTALAMLSYLVSLFLLGRSPQPGGRTGN